MILITENSASVDARLELTIGDLATVNAREMIKCMPFFVMMETPHLCYPMVFQDIITIKL